MASPCNPHHFLSRRFSRWLPVVLIMTWTFIVSGSAKQIEVRGEVGANVTIQCPSTKDKSITLFYFQKDQTFINGYFTSKTIRDGLKWENTRVDNGSTTVHMYNLNVSHIGTYKCIIRYTDGSETFVNVLLSVTATYSKPEVTVVCGDDNPTCLVSCTSHGGYPKSNMEWNVPRIQMWRLVNKSEMQDRNTLMFNSSSTASFNCSEGELTFSCTVGNVTSEMFTICKGPPPPFEQAQILAAIIVIGVVVLAIMVAVMCWKHKRRQRGAAAAADVRLEWRVNGHEEEGVNLTENGGGNNQP